MIFNGTSCIDLCMKFAAIWNFLKYVIVINTPEKGNI